MIRIHDSESETEMMEKYNDIVEQYIKINAAIDLMRIGIDYYSNKYPDDKTMAHGAFSSLKYMLEMLHTKIKLVRRYRVKAKLEPLPHDIQEATKQLFQEHFNVNLDGEE